MAKYIEKNNKRNIQGVTNKQLRGIAEDLLAEWKADTKKCKKCPVVLAVHGKDVGKKIRTMIKATGSRTVPDGEQYEEEQSQTVAMDISLFIYNKYMIILLSAVNGSKHNILCANDSNDIREQMAFRHHI